MRIALIGYGKMGKAVEKVAIERGHTITAIVDLNSQIKISEDLKSISDVAIEFSSPSAAYQNVFECLELGIPIVCGTTGWDFDPNKAEQLCFKNSTSCFYASNYSIGVNIMMEINKKLASLMQKFLDFEVNIEETHHIHKIDKPSGTAITLAQGILNNNKKYVNWELNPVTKKNILGITSFREGEVFGDHRIVWKNEIENISLAHSATSRLGFATGAMLAAEHIYSKIGYFTMKDLLNL